MLRGVGMVWGAMYRGFGGALVMGYESCTVLGRRVTNGDFARLNVSFEMPATSAKPETKRTAKKLLSWTA